MDSYETTSTFGSLLGTAVGWYFGGPIGGAVVGSILGGLFGSASKSREQAKEQKRLAEAQNRQNRLLRDKLKADTAELYSSVSSAVNQTSGAMGAIY